MTLKDIIEIEDEVDKIMDALQIIDAFIPAKAEDLSLTLERVGVAMSAFGVLLMAHKNRLKKDRK